MKASVFIAGGAGFIGRRLTRSLVGLGESVTVMDIAPQDGDFDDLGDKARVVRGDISQFDDVMDKMSAAKAGSCHQSRLLHRQSPSTARGDEAERHRYDNFFEAARLTGAKRVVYASSLAVYDFSATMVSAK